MVTAYKVTLLDLGRLFSLGGNGGVEGEGGGDGGGGTGGAAEK